MDSTLSIPRVSAPAPAAIARPDHRRGTSTYEEGRTLHSSIALPPSLPHISSRRSALEADSGFEGMLGHSAIMRDVYALVRRVAATQATVLVTGETGTGKELVARGAASPEPPLDGTVYPRQLRRSSESLLESELFGHVKGAFTDGNREPPGRFEAAHGGTIFLDEINSISYKLQVKLLRILQEHEFERVGDTPDDSGRLPDYCRHESRFARERSMRAAFARICIIGSTWCRFICRR